MKKNKAAFFKLAVNLSVLLCAFTVHNSSAEVVHSTWVSTTILMQEYNTIVLNNLTPEASKIKGSLYVGGNITVSGSLNNVLNNENGGDITVGGLSSPVTLSEVSTGINVQDIRTRFEILSTELSMLSTNGIIEAGNLLTPDNESGITLTPTG